MSTRSSWSGFFWSSGHAGLFITHGSTIRTLPPDVRNLNVPWPSHVTSVPFRSTRALLSDPVSAVDRDRDSCNEIRCGRCEENRGAGVVVRKPPPPHRRPAQDLV